MKIPARKEPIVMGKPEVNMFKALQQAFNLDPARCLMVGDRSVSVHLTVVALGGIS